MPRNNQLATAQNARRAEKNPSISVGPVRGAPVPQRLSYPHHRHCTGHVRLSVEGGHLAITAACPPNSRSRRSRQHLTEADVDQCQLVNETKVADQLNSLSSVMGISRTHFSV